VDEAKEDIAKKYLGAPEVSEAFQRLRDTQCRQTPESRRQDLERIEDALLTGGLVDPGLIMYFTEGAYQYCLVPCVQSGAIWQHPYVSLSIA
jgi:hypothetical protein